MVTTEKDMIRPLVTAQKSTPAEERFTSLQPTYEDIVPPEQDDAWDEER